MKTYAALIRYVDGILERRAPHRAAHLANLQRLVEEGKVILAGAWTDPLDGALVVYRGSSKEEVEAMMHNDPYYHAGLWTSYEIREWNVVISITPAALPDAT